MSNIIDTKPLMKTFRYIREQLPSSANNVQNKLANIPMIVVVGSRSYYVTHVDQIQIETLTNMHSILLKCEAANENESLQELRKHTKSASFLDDAVYDMHFKGANGIFISIYQEDANGNCSENVVPLYEDNTSFLLLGDDCFSSKFVIKIDESNDYLDGISEANNFKSKSVTLYERVG